jgi:sulfite reductase beta subunit-like hemoprotein
MAGPNIPDAKRAGLPVDVSRLARDGADWLTPDERYALKTHGVCTQSDPDRFMIRIRTDGRLGAAAARGLADLADDRGRRWVHLTTRQQVELHHIADRAVPFTLAAITALGLSTRSACGHTVRGVMSCPDAGVGLDEPFDSTPDATAAAHRLLARTPQLDTELPQRINVAFGGCPACRDHARLNEIGFVATLDASGRPAYELWVGGSLGKSQPTLAIRVPGLIERADVPAAIDALLEVFVSHGDFDHPGKARMKHLIRALGVEDFLDLFGEAFRRARETPHPPPPPVEPAPAALITDILAAAPEGGWDAGVRPQRTPGLALVTVAVPLGDLDGAELRTLADLAEGFGDGWLHLTRTQDVTLRDVAVADVPLLRAAIGDLGLSLAGTPGASQVRCCTGGPVCALAVTPSTAVGTLLLSSPALARNSALRVSISGCPNACAQHQVADIGFSGGKVTIAGKGRLGYQVWLGGDLRAGRVGTVVGRVADRDVPAVTEAIVGLWESLRTPGEAMADTVRRLGPEAFGTHVARVCAGRWEIGPEPDPDLVVVDRALPLAVAS